MSASTLLIDGKINPSLVPASVVPQQPTFQTLTITPPIGFDGLITINSESGTVELLKNDTDPTFAIENDNDRFITHNSTGAGTAVFGSVDAVGVVGLAAANNANVVAPIITLGKGSLANPDVNVLGSAGLGQVYDEKYNTPLKQAIAIPDIGAGLFTLNTTGNVGQFIAPATGWFIFQTVFSLPDVAKNTIVDNNGLIEWFVEAVPGGEVLGGSMTVLGSTLNVKASAPAVTAPIDYTFQNFCYLTDGTQYEYTIQAFAGATPDGTWALPTIVRVIQAC
jgi:hypothetical protein